MNSIILCTATRVLTPLMLAFSVFLLVRGHNDPGGGFVGGLVAAAAFSLYKLAYGVQAAERVLRINPRRLVGVGLLTALASGLLSVGRNLPFLTGLWAELGFLGKIGTPLLFDAGVFLVVIGVVLTIVFSLGED